MQTDIIIDTDKGKVLLAVTTASTFDLKGPAEAIEALQGLAPVLKTEGNSTDIAGDVLARMVYHTANEGLTQRRQPLLSHEEMVSRTFTENPLVFFQTRIETPELDHALKGLFETWGIPADGVNARGVLDALEQLREESLWKTERVFIDPAEAERFVEVQPHRYAPDQEGKRWRFYTGIADGQLKTVVKDARTLAQV